jgi:NAD(P)-dependent dehydrogenase (short-subunit alcohol dehydrogenase family)
MMDETRDNGSRSERYLKGRTALVTGGAKRIGRHLGLALARAGARVVIHYRTSREAATATAAQIEKLGVAATLLQGDLADPEIAAGLVARVVAQSGPLDILINNASIFAVGAMQTTTLAEWEANQAVNLRAPFLLSQAFAQQLPAEVTGDIINLNDFRALRPGADHFPYTISKVGLHGLTRSLAQALAPRIRVNELALGAVLPPENETEDYLHVLREQIPTRRFSKPEEVASALLFLLTNPAVTGQTVCIDGGRHLT